MGTAFDAAAIRAGTICPRETGAAVFSHAESGVSRGACGRPALGDVAIGGGIDRSATLDRFSADTLGCEASGESDGGELAGIGIARIRADHVDGIGSRGWFGCEVVRQL